jgi:hypothetical protein
MKVKYVLALADVEAVSSSLPMVSMQRTVPRARQVRRILRKCGESDFNARTGVLRLELSGNNEGDDGQTWVIEDCFIMDTIATEPRITKSHAAPGHLGRTSEIGFVQNARVENLDIETVTSNPFLPADRKWAIRFNAGGTVTIVLGMRDYGRAGIPRTSRASSRLVSEFRSSGSASITALPLRPFCRPPCRLPSCSTEAISARLRGQSPTSLRGCATRWLRGDGWPLPQWPVLVLGMSASISRRVFCAG